MFSIWGHLHAELQTSMPRVGLWIDTSDVTAGQAVNVIAANLDEALIPEGQVDEALVPDS